MIRNTPVKPFSGSPESEKKTYTSTISEPYKGEGLKVPTVADFAKNVATKEKGSDEVGKSRPRAVDLLGSERSSFPIADKFPKDSEPESKTDKPAPPNEEMVNVAVECRLCGHEEIQKSYKFNTFITCYGCRQKLYLQPAGAKSGDLDKQGNYFVAKHKLLSAKERWEHKNSKKG